MNSKENDIRVTIRHYILTRGLKFRHVSEKAGIGENRFYGLMTSNATLAFNEYIDICKALEIEPQFFLTRCS